MRIDLTPEQAAELDNDLWADDDGLRNLPPVVYISELAEQEDGSFAMAHPALTFEDEIILHFVLDERAARTAAINALPKDERSAARTALRQAIRQEIRRDARKQARLDARAEEREDVQAENQAMRVALRQDARIAERIAERKAELEAAPTAPAEPEEPQADAIPNWEDLTAKEIIDWLDDHPEHNDSALEYELSRTTQRVTVMRALGQAD